MNQSSDNSCAVSNNCGKTEPVKINQWNIQEVRVAFEDSVVKFMNEETKFKEDHFFIYTKLIANLLLNIIGGGTAFYSYHIKSFEKTKLVVAIGSAVYLIGTGIWSLILQYYLTRTLYRGNDDNVVVVVEGGKKSIWIRSDIKFPQGIFSLQLVNPKDGKLMGKSIEFGVGEWIDVDGVVLYEERIVKDLKDKLVPLFKQE